jgi:carboxylesterase
VAIMRGAEPFLLPGGDRGALLIHGFSGAPSEMRLLGDWLHGRGLTVLGVRLAGHGTSPEDMARTKWPHWYAAVEDGFHLLRGLCGEVNAAGLSMGALLAFKLAVEYPVARVAAVNAPLHLFDKRVPLLPIYRLFRRFERQEKRRYAVGELYNVAYDSVPLASLTSLLDLIRHTDGLLPFVDRPALLLQARRDRTVRPDSANHIYRRLASRDKQLVWLERSGHVATLDVEHEQVFRRIGDFFAAKAANDGKELK